MTVNKITIDNFSDQATLTLPATVLSSVTDPGGTGWVWANGANSQVKVVCTNKATNAYIIVYHGATTQILYTTDFISFSWKTLPGNIGSPSGFVTPSGSSLLVSSNESGEVLILSSTNTRVYKSTDSGQTWSDIAASPTSPVCSVYCNGRYICGRDSTVQISTNSGTSWGSPSGTNSSRSTILATDGVSLVITGRNGVVPVGNMALSTNGGASFNLISNFPVGASGGALENAYIIGGVIIIQYNGDYLLFSRDSGATWDYVRVGYSSNSVGSMYYRNGIFYLVTGSLENNARIYVSTNLFKWTRVTVNQLLPITTITGLPGGLFYSSGTMGSIVKHNTYFSGTEQDILMYGMSNTYPLSFARGILSYKAGGNESYVSVTATHNTGAVPPVTLKLPVRLTTNSAQPVMSLQAFPGAVQFQATADGVIYPATYTSSLTVYKNGIEESGWSFSVTNDTGVTSSITGNVLSVTGLTTAVDSAFANVTANKISENTIFLKIPVTKNKSGTPSGATPGSYYSAFSTTETSVSLKFLTSGYFQIKYGTGSYNNAGTWYGPPNAVSPQGASYWINMNYTSTTSDVLAPTAPSTLNTWQNMNVDREYVLSNSGAGSHIVELIVAFSTTSTGTTPVVGHGTLRLQV